MNLCKSFSALLILTILIPAASGTAEPVSIRVEDKVIPTYRIGEPERSPLFYDGRIYQGAQGRVYPYAMMDILTDDRYDKTWQAVYLENEYLELSLLPEAGGRLFSALDKTNGYDIIYRQSVIKPALIGMLGAWLSGGVEWNIPHHHRASTYMPVDYTLQDNPDGSKTVWVGELELRHRMHWALGITVFPGKSYFKATVKLFNRTPLANSVLYWANLSVHANEDYQVFFPPSTQYGTDHNKIEFTQWPISHSIYRGVDFRGGMDLTWWKNHPRQTSAFAWNYTDDFISGYDHGRQAGICHVADHHFVPGKKFFEWGNGPVGRMWDKVLTDSDGPYLELMTGAWSDNQPDYSWTQPYETRIAEQYWYPLQGMGGAKKANLDAAVNLEILESGKLFAGLNVTSDFPGGRVLVKCGEKALLDKRIDISPDNPFTVELPLPSGAGEEDCGVLLFAADGRELISYQPLVLPAMEQPESVKPPRLPSALENNEDLYLTGMRLEQFYNPVLDPEPYYEEALRRDPGDYRVNVALGIRRLKQHRFSEAEILLRRAAERHGRQHTMPRDGEAFYYLGRALELGGRLDEAADYYYKAAWSRAFQGPAFYELAEIACGRGNYEAALGHLENSLAVDIRNTQALNLKATVLRLLGRADPAAACARNVLELNPLDFRAGYELGLMGMQPGGGLRDRHVGGNVQDWLELAVSYGNAGLAGEAVAVLEGWLEKLGNGKAVHPMVYYWLGYLNGQRGKHEQADRYLEKAAAANPDYCFPFRSESIRALRFAAERNPDDALSPYYLGNLLFDHQPDTAIAWWEQARNNGCSHWTLYRNLGYAYSQRQGDPAKSIASYRRALALNGNEPRLFYELDVVSAVGNVDPGQRLELLEANHEILLARYDAVTREAILLVLLGEYDRAIELMTTYHFHKWEGFGVIHNVYVDAYLLRGRQKFERGEYNAALEDYLQALEFPLNLEVGRPYRDEGSWRVHYFIGTACEALGDKEKARAHYKQAVPDMAAPGEILYCQGMAFRKLNDEGSAAQAFKALIDAGRGRLEGGGGSSVFAKFGERQAGNILESDGHLMIGLGLLGQGDREQARKHLAEALELNVSNLAAKTALAEL